MCICICFLFVFVLFCNRLWKHKMGLLVAQRTIRGYMIGKTWPWWSLWLALKVRKPLDIIIVFTFVIIVRNHQHHYLFSQPGLKSGHFEEFKQELADKIQFAQDHLEEVIGERDAAQKKHDRLAAEVN